MARSALTALARKPAAVAVALCLGAGTADANPIGPTVVSGQVSIRQTGNLLQVTNSPNSIINWQSFSIGTNEITRFLQQSAASAVLNRVTAQNPSQILGALQSNGRVFLINPSGIVFGAGAQIDVAGLVASTLNMSDADFLGGRLRFTEGLGKALVNEGSITTPAGGQVYLVGPSVVNSGVITTPKGEVVLAAGNSVELVNPGTPHLRVEITAPENEARNLGTIVADAGRVGIYGGLINHSGTIRADNAQVTEDGRIVLKATKNVTLDAGSVTTANGPKGGTVEIQSGNTTLVAGAVEATGSVQKGGTVHVLGNLVGLIGGASIDVGGETGGGTVLVGGDFQGKNPNIQNAFRTYFGPNATISADAITAGDGGKVIVWSDDSTRAYGTIFARGGSQSGDGGFVETSGRNYLDVEGIRVNTLAPGGRAGTWLLDPVDGTVIHQAGGSPVGDPFAPATNFTISDSTINATLATTNLTIQTSGGATGNGDIVFQDDTVAIVNTAAGRTLTFNADRDLVLRGGITAASSGSLTVNLNVTGQVQTPAGASFTLDGGTAGITAVVNNSRTWNNNGVVTLAGTSTIRLPNPGSGYATFSNNPGATLNINAAAGWSFLSDPSVQGGIVNNAGTFNVQQSTSWEAAFTNTSTGTLNIAPSINLSMQNGRTIAGNVSIGAGSNFWVSERHGVNALFDGTAITGTGTLLVQSGISPVADITNVNAPGIRLSINGGTANILNGTSTFGSLSFSSGSLNLNNGIFAQTGGTLTVPAGVNYTGNVGYKVGGTGTLNLANSIATTGSVTLVGGSISGPGTVNGVDVEMTATSGNLAVASVNAGGHAILRAPQGAITDQNGVGVGNVMARHLEAAARNGIELDISLSGGSPSFVNATNSGSGPIVIRGTGTPATIQNIHNAGGSNVLSGLTTNADSTVATGGIVIHGDWGSGSGGQDPASPANPLFAFSTTGGNVVITLNSPRANTLGSDPYVYLLSANRAVLAQDDDNGLQGFVAVINPPTPLNQFPGFGNFSNVVNLGPGTYIVVAATFSPGQQTPFDLSIAGPVISVPVPPVVAPPGGVSGGVNGSVLGGVNIELQQVIAATNSLANLTAPEQERTEPGGDASAAGGRRGELPVCR